MDTQYALILFADVIDSSVHSAVAGIKSYAMQLLALQQLFKDLGSKYFPPPEDPVISFSEIQVRGDEGSIFYVAPDMAPGELVHKAVQFAYELKARIEMLDQGDDDVSPKRMKIAVGIHFGEVASVTSLIPDDQGKTRSLMSGILGYAINYAKRIESSARLGRYSKIFLSKEAASLLKGDPIVLVKHEAQLEGIERREEMYEVRSAYFDKMPLETKSFDSEKFIERYTNSFTEQDLVREPWLKGLILSVIDARLKNVISDPLKSYYSEKRSMFTWLNPTEDDPIVLFCRAMECFHGKKHTLMLTYFKSIVIEYPHFLHARIKFAQACWEVSRKATVRAEWVLARDIADEFLTRYETYLSPTERDYFMDIRAKSKKTVRR